MERAGEGSLQAGQKDLYPETQDGSLGILGLSCGVQGDFPRRALG